MYGRSGCIDGCLLHSIDTSANYCKSKFFVRRYQCIHAQRRSDLRHHGASMLVRGSLCIKLVSDPVDTSQVYQADTFKGSCGLDIPGRNIPAAHPCKRNGSDYSIQLPF